MLTVVVFASYAAVALAGQAWVGAGTHTPPILVPLYVLAMLLVANPLRARVQAIVDRLFHRQGYSYRAAVEATSRALASVLDTDRIAATVLRDADRRDGGRVGGAGDPRRGGTSRSGIYGRACTTRRRGLPAVLGNE